MTYHFSKEERVEMSCQYENGVTLGEIGAIFQCSWQTISGILIKEFGEESYKKIVKKHLKKNHQELGRKLGKKYGPENGKKNGPENIKKAHKLPRSEKQLEHSRKSGKKVGRKYGLINLEKMLEANAKNHNFTSRPEALFYITRLTKNFYPKDIIPQYYIKEIKHRVDFAVPSQKLLFEVDGDYTHSRPGRKERDAQIDKWAKDNSWTMFRFNDKKMKKLGII